MSTLSIGISGLTAANIGLATTSHNIANASTLGYNRQVLVQGTNLPVLTGAGFIGQGTQVETVRRIYDQFLSRQVLSAQASTSEMDSYLGQIQQIDNLLADASSGVSPALSAFFAGVQEVAAYPTSIPARQAMLSSSESLVARFQALDQRLTEIRDGVNSQVMSEVTLINSYSGQIAELNQAILQSRAGGFGQEPNDLLDQRDQLIAELNKSVRVSTVEQGDGSINVFIGNGQPLVVGNQRYTLKAIESAADPRRIVVGMATGGGNVIELPESQIVGGTLGGLVAFRGESLDSAQNALGRVAIALALGVNEQHQLGMDLTGALGGAYFSVAAPVPVPGDGNTGTASIGASFATTAASDLTTSDYRLSYAAGVYTLTRLSDDTSWTGGSAAAVATTAAQGFDLTLNAGVPANGDSFLIQPTRTGAQSIAVAISDPRAIAAAAPIRTAKTLTNTGTGSISAGVVLDATDAALLTTTTINFVAGGYQINGAGAVIPYTSGANIDLNGWRVVISGAPAVGDVFTVEANTAGVADNRNAMLLAALQTASTMAGGTAGYQSAYSQIVSAVGNKTRQVETIGQAQANLVTQAAAQRERVSGVNLDEEAANLLRYQQAYQASAKVIQIAGSLFDDLLAVLN
ncbi:MAG: flagellar hook-associated protein FlgK [Rhodocyclaceae bacterium]|nr:flagellar hook-associated protein FlgK [Rhodocyclaceae bacterium]MBK6553904.1 flagellar hook-associated protein FlgK [Rhodocyclaceae bacterium]MBK6678140.1 flagellar hook-associated protein FlgK [Rhodocyclaceae bacterium]MBK9310818.1 flagellar hook-associated protein FlgK [Rhodocyclaceae bacterium]